jgi:broad specificity phosphatase PhoE
MLDQKQATFLLTWTLMAIHLNSVVDALTTRTNVAFPKSAKQRILIVHSKMTSSELILQDLPKQQQQQSKRIVWIRHGSTYMNELIGGGGTSYGQPGFTDVFEEDDKIHQYRDSPLSPVGVQQALDLREKLSTSSDIPTTDFSLIQELELVVVSPLTRALQTMELALYDHVKEQQRDIPIVALPLAAERVYLISDHGKSRTTLQQNYPFVDFDTHFVGSSVEGNDPWYFIPTAEQEQSYVEWRPNGQGQVYACLGEPQDVFDRRMSQLYHWLQSREEQCIVVVCHAGVIEWMTSGEILANCEVRIQAFDELQPRTLLHLV